MKLIVRSQPEADQLCQALRFMRWDYQDRLSIIIPDSIDFRFDAEFILLEKTDALPQEGAPLVFASFETATACWGDIILLCISNVFSILYLPQESSPEESDIINRIVADSDCYIFFTDRRAREWMSGRRFHAIEFPQALYRDSQPPKLLVCSNQAVLQVLLCTLMQDYLCFGIKKDLYYPILGMETIQHQAPALSRKLLWTAELGAAAKLAESDLRQVVIMTMDRHHAAYSSFADYYDDYMAHVDYELWISRVLAWQSKYSPRACQRILELACGTANVATKLASKGYQIDASDISAAMLRVAATKAPKPNLYQAALTDPIPERDYDLIICMFDSINYLTELPDLSSLFANVHAALAPQGLFIFDISTLLNSLENFSDVCNITDDTNHTLIHEARYEPHHRRQISIINDFVRFGAAYRRTRETHIQRVYLNEELLRIIAQSPLQILAIHSTEHKANLYPKKMQHLDTEHYRLFYILGKP